MKVTKRQLRKIIKEAFLPQLDGPFSRMQSRAHPEFAAAIKGRIKEATHESSAGVDIFDDDVSDQAIRDAWPDRVEADGVNVFNAIYGNDAVMNRVFQAVEDAGYDQPNEVYLGWDPDSLDFIIGFDAFEAYEDEYGSMDYGEMEGVFVNLMMHPGGSITVGRAVLFIPGGVYGSGRVNMELEREFPGILHIRLD